MEANAAPESDQAAPLVHATTFMFAGRLFVCGVRELSRGGFQAEAFLRGASGGDLIVLTEPEAFQQPWEALNKAKEAAVRWTLANVS